MKRLPLITLLLPLLLLSKLHAQDVPASLLRFNWDENRTRVALSATEEALPKYILKNSNIAEYTFEKGDFVLYTLDHQIVRVNSDEAIESANKIMIPMGNTIALIAIKARTMTADGRKIELDQNNIKEIPNDENSNAYKIFAIEGIEKGCEIEYFYVRKQYPSVYSSEIVQFSAPVKETDFKLICPSHLVFRFKGYCGFPSVADTTVEPQNIYSVHIANIPELRDEPFANYQRNRMRVEYKLATNLAKSRKEIYTWAEVAQNQYAILTNISKDEQKACEKAFKKLGIKDTYTVEEKVRAIENYIKTNIVIEEIYQNDNNTLDKILDNHFGNKSGLVKLYQYFLKLAGVKYQLVLTSNRNELPFDGAFESWRFLNNYLIYIVETDKFLTPEESYYRYPLIPFGQTYTDGLFMKVVSIGGMETAVPMIKFIPPADYQTTQQNVIANIQFNPGLTLLKTDIRCEMKGYYAVFTQPYYPLVPDDKKQEMAESILKEFTKEAKFENLKVENFETNTPITEKPFVVSGTSEGAELIEFAGSKILFKLGEIIGPQMEMYQDKIRKLGVENDYNREYNRSIVFTVPQGYTIKNPEDINISHVFKKGNDNVFGFESDYTFAGNLLKVNIHEYYKDIECPMEHYEDYRTVINASADFNKIVLVLVKQ